MEKMNKKEFIEKCIWEGGRLYHGLVYGLRHDDLDDSDPEFKQMIQKAEQAYLAYEAIENEIEEKYGYFEEYSE